MIELIPSILVILVLLLFSGFFSGSETALFSLSKIERRRIVNRHSFIGCTVDGLLERPRRTLITILIGNMVVNTLATAIVTLIAIRFFGDMGVGLTVAVFTVVLLLFGEIMPKVFAVRNNMLIAEINAVALDILAKLIFPVRFLVRKVSDWTISLLIKGGTRSQSDLISEDELKALVKIGEEEGVLRKEEVGKITKLIDLGRRQTKEIMAPKTEFIAFNIDEGRGALIQLIKKSHFSYVPVYEKSADNLLGVISTQEFMLGPASDIRKLVQPSHYIPETKRIDELLLEFKLKGKRFAICVNEYGSVSGFVTFEDVIEEIFGEFRNEYTKTESLVKEVRSGEYVVQAKITLRELHQALGVRLQSASSETLNGWILERLGRIPAYNESFSFEGIQFQIVEVFKNKINKVNIRKH